MPEPNPIKNCNELYIKDLLIAEIRDRSERGLQTYGTYLQANNGRNALQDILEELLDGAMYIKQKIIEEHVEPNELW